MVLNIFVHKHLKVYTLYKSERNGTTGGRINVMSVSDTKEPLVKNL